MRMSQEEKTRSHARIVASAARLFRERGLDGASVADVMQDAGMTHGGFYKHFDSKDALVAETYAERIDGVIDGLLAPAAAAAPGEELSAALDVYLSSAHRDDRAHGCVFAAQTAEVGRGDAPGRAEFSAGITRYFARLATLLSPRIRRRYRDADIVLASGMLGAILLARAVDDPALGDRILAANRDFYRTTLGDSR